MTEAAVMRLGAGLRGAMLATLFILLIPAPIARAQVPPLRAPSVLLDCYYNNEWKTDASGNLVRFHYIWSDTANSGFSILGGIITRSGALIDTLCRAPSRKALQRASIYLIVDPDTPLENRAPNYIQPADITLIADWVRRGEYSS